MLKRILRLLYAVVLLGVAGFAGFGFLATFEPDENTLPWRIGYAAMGVGAIIVAIWLLVPRRRKAGHNG